MILQDKMGTLEFALSNILQVVFLVCSHNIGHVECHVTTKTRVALTDDPRDEQHKHGGQGGINHNPNISTMYSSTRNTSIISWWPYARPSWAPWWNSSRAPSTTFLPIRSAWSTNPMTKWTRTSRCNNLFMICKIRSPTRKHHVHHGTGSPANHTRLLTIF